MATKKSTIEIRVIKPLWGKFKLPYKVGQDVKIESKMASELMKAGFATNSADAKKADEIDRGEGGDKE